MLQDLIQNPNVLVKDIQSELEQLDKKEQLMEALNGQDLESRPLHLALQYASAEVVSLFLDFDSQITAETKNFFSKRSRTDGINKIAALLDFHGYLQSQPFDANFPFGKTLALIRESMEYLDPYRMHQQREGIMLVGNTGAGKSSLFNVLYSGLEYEEVEDNTGVRTWVTTQKEEAKTNSSPTSETTYPLIREKIFKEKNMSSWLIDMPGDNDTRGLAYQIAIGLSAMGLSDCFNKLRTLAVVVREAHIYDIKVESLQKTLTMVGEMVRKRPELLDNIILIVNHVEKPKLSPAMVKGRFEQLLSKVDKKFDPAAKFVLENLREDQIMVIKNAPGEDFRQAFFNRAQAMKNIPDFKEFDMSTYNTQIDFFKKLLERLRGYQQLQQAEVDLIKAAAVKPLIEWQQKLMQRQAIKIEHLKSSDPLVQEQTETVKSRQLALKIYQAHLDLYGKEACVQSTKVESMGNNLLSAAETRHARIAIVDELFAKLEPVLARLKLDFTKDKNNSNYSGKFFPEAPSGAEKKNDEKMAPGIDVVKQMHTPS